MRYILRLKNLQSVTVELRHDSTSDARILINGILENFSEILNRTSTSGIIVENSTFESAFAKIQYGKEASLFAREKRAIKFLEDFDTGRDAAITSHGFTLAETFLKKQKTEAISIKSSYKNSRFIVCTSHLCERPFSRVRYTVNERCNAISPTNFASQPFQHANSHS